MALASLLDLSPLVAFPIKKSLVWDRINLWTVKHLSMDQAKTFQGYDNHIAVKLTDSDHKGSRHILIRYQNIDYVAKSKLRWRPLANFAILLNPITNVHIMLFLSTWKCHIDETRNVLLRLRSLYNLRLRLLD